MTYKVGQKIRHSGFTLIELLLVLVLIALLAGIVTPTVTKSIHRAKESTLKEDLFILRKAIDDYYTDRGKYPEDLQMLVEEKYIRKIPMDPITNDSWSEVKSEAEGNMENIEEGIIDIRTRSQQISLTGEPYSEW